MIYAGIDEAGYGPMFGPLVITRSVFSLDRRECNYADPPSLWGMLRTAVSKKAADKKKRIAVNDSKKIYYPAAGLRHLERGVLSFAGCAGMHAENMDRLFREIGLDEESFPGRQNWYKRKDGSPKIPLANEHKKIMRDEARLERCMQRNHIKLESLQAAVIYADRFNRMARSLRSKSGCAWVFVSQHLEYVWNTYGKKMPLVVVDRQGGRRDYLRLLNILFPFAHVDEVEKNAKTAVYNIENRSNHMRVIFQIDSEKNHLPAALASMTSKYLRELCMIRFQEFWRTHAPDVRPTFGYFQDGKRFLEEISHHIDRMKIDKDTMIRCC
jgi:hypothetical protein